MLCVKWLMILRAHPQCTCRWSDIPDDSLKVLSWHMEKYSGWWNTSPKSSVLLINQKKFYIHIQFIYIFTYMCVWSVRVLVGQSCPTPLPWSVAHQAPLSMEFSRQEYWSGSPFPLPVDLLNLGIKPTSLVLAGWFFAIWVIRKFHFILLLLFFLF